MPILILNHPNNNSSTPIAQEFSQQGIGDYVQYKAVEIEDIENSPEYFSKFTNDETNVTTSEFARFMSHRLAWEEVIRQNLSYALICENDVHLVDQSMNKAMSSIEAIHGKTDFIFINNHMTCWNEKGFQYFDEILQAILEGNTPKEFSGKFGDGYFISQGGAQKLLSISEKDKVMTTLDWYVFANCINSENIDLQKLEENHALQNFVEATGGRKALLNGGISPHTLLILN